MLLKIIGGIIISVGTWLLGKNVENKYREKIKTIDSFIFLLYKLKSAIAFSGTNMYSFFENNADAFTKNFLEYLVIKKNPYALNEYLYSNDVEKKCISIFMESLTVAENSSDADLISESLEESINKLKQYKNEFLEEHRGKMKTAPAIGLIIGVFVAVLII